MTRRCPQPPTDFDHRRAGKRVAIQQVQPKSAATRADATTVRSSSWPTQHGWNIALYQFGRGSRPQGRAGPARPLHHHPDRRHLHQRAAGNRPHRRRAHRRAPVPHPPAFQPETCAKARTQETSSMGTRGPPHAQPRRLTALRRRQLWAPARYPPSGAPGNTARSRRRHPRAALTSSHGGGIDAAAARRGRNESRTALAVPFNRSWREATP